MYGWRARVGVIVSPPNSVVENEFLRMAPDGVSIHAARLRRPQGVGGGLSSNVVLDTNQDLMAAAGSLTELKLGAVVFAHTSGSMLRGPAYNQELVAALGETVGCWAVTTASAVVDALNALRITKLGILAPYPEEMTLKEVDFLEEAKPGLKVVNHRSLGLGTGSDLGDMEPSVAYHESSNVDSPGIEALFLSGTNWRTVEVIESMEADLGKPVITANQVTMWATLKELNIQPKPGYGAIFSCR